MRPYDGGVTHLLIARSADPSFPSDHATATFATAAAFLLHGMRRVGLDFLAAVALVTVSRVYRASTVLAIGRAQVIAGTSRRTRALLFNFPSSVLAAASDAGRALLAGPAAYERCLVLSALAAVTAARQSRRSDAVFDLRIRITPEDGLARCGKLERLIGATVVCAIHASADIATDDRPDDRPRNCCDLAPVTVAYVRARDPARDAAEHSANDFAIASDVSRRTWRVLVTVIVLFVNDFDFGLINGATWRHTATVTLLLDLLFAGPVVQLVLVLAATVLVRVLVVLAVVMDFDLGSVTTPILAPIRERGRRAEADDCSARDDEKAGDLGSRCMHSHEKLRE